MPENNQSNTPQAPSQTPPNNFSSEQESSEDEYARNLNLSKSTSSKDDEPEGKMPGMGGKPGGQKPGSGQNTPQLPSLPIVGGDVQKLALLKSLAQGSGVGAAEAAKQIPIVIAKMALKKMVMSGVVSLVGILVPILLILLLLLVAFWTWFRFFAKIFNFLGF